AAARRLEARVDDRLALDAQVDAHDVAADRAAGAAGMAVRDRVAAADRLIQMLGEALVGHTPESRAASSRTSRGRGGRGRLSAPGGSASGSAARGGESRGSPDRPERRS